MVEEPTATKRGLLFSCTSTGRFCCSRWQTCHRHQTGPRNGLGRWRSHGRASSCCTSWCCFAWRQPGERGAIAVAGVWMTAPWRSCSSSARSARFAVASVTPVTPVERSLSYCPRGPPELPPGSLCCCRWTLPHGPRGLLGGGIAAPLFTGTAVWRSTRGPHSRYILFLQHAYVALPVPPHLCVCVCVCLCVSVCLCVCVCVCVGRAGRETEHTWCAYVSACRGHCQ